MRLPNYEKCVLCGQVKPIDYFTKGGLCDRKCEDCVGKDYVPVFAREPLAVEKSVDALVASMTMTILVTAGVSFAAGFYVSSAMAASQVLEALSR